MQEKNFVENGKLYLVATPIGNMSDISLRGKNVLENVDFIAAEDTRVSIKLLSYLGIKKELVSYYEHNKKERGAEIIERLIRGESCALVTDAGTPAISDPGEDLVVLCAQCNIDVISIPGPCAAITALTVSALPTGKFVFEGFLPVKGKERRERLEFLAGETRTMIFYEAPHKISATLSDLYVALGDRRVTICREITKLNEETIRTTLSNAVNLYSADNHPRGEFVIVIEGGVTKEEKIVSDEDIIDAIENYISMGKTPSDAIKTVSKEFGLSKNDVYAKYLTYKQKN